MRALKKTKTLAHGYSSESTQREIINEYKHDRVKIFQKIFASSLGLSRIQQVVNMNIFTNIGSRIRILIFVERSENQSAVLPFKDRNGPQAQPVSTGIRNRAPTGISNRAPTT